VDGATPGPTRVEALRAMIAEGRYRIDLELLAARILELEFLGEPAA
jgi:anti-sigma28 factor (negative regulator of flagellin synthesis)